MKKLLFIAAVLFSMNSNAQLLGQQFNDPWTGTPPAPPSWSVINVGGTGVTWEQTLPGTQYPPYGGTGHAALLRIDTEPATNPVQQDWLVTDLIQIPAGPVSLRFFSRLLLNGDQGSTYKVLYAPSVADPTMPSSYTELQSWTEFSLNPVQLEYTEKSINIPPMLAGTMVRFAFVMTGNNADGWLVDNVTFAAMCSSPTNLTVTNLSLTSATLGWTSDSATSWEIEVLPVTAAPTGQGSVVMANPVTVSATTSGALFEPGMEYRYYVRSICTDGGISPWVGPMYFSNNGCQMPTNVILSASTPQALTYTWTGTGAANGYDYWFTAGNEVPNASTIPTGNAATTTATLVLLEPGVNYKFYVRSNCGSGNVSPWAGLPAPPNVMNNILHGKVRYDSNTSGICDDEDVSLLNTQVQISVNNGQQYSVYTNVNGEYTIYSLADGNYTVTAQVVSPFFTADPLVQEVTFDEVINVAEINYCLGQPVPYNDLKVTFVSLGVARPGFDTSYKVFVQNSGSSPIEDAVVTLSFNNNRISYVTSGFTGVTATAGSLSIPVGDLQAFSSVNGNIIFHTMTPPTNIGGEILHFEATLSEVPNDVTPYNNYAILNQIIVNSYDPNDITVHEGAKIYQDQADDYLTYTIRFQNTGNGEAINVKLENTLDELLDWDTFEPITSSHNNSVKREGNELEFYFADINLPYESADEPGSHGFVTYRIKPKATYGLGDVVYNTAEIYFDFNEAIVTNTASTEVIEETAGLNNNILAIAKLYPNPVNNQLHVEVAQGELQAVTVYDTNGRLCLLANTNTIDTHTLKSGIYFVKVTTDSGSANYKLIKQ